MSGQIKGKRAVSRIAVVSIIVILIAVVVLGIFLAYSLDNFIGASNSTQKDNLSLEGFSLDPSSSNLTGTVMMSSRSSLTRMDLYVNGTFVGSMNYTMGMTYSSAYSMMYSTSPRIMPMMSKMTMVAGQNYNVTLVAHFSDGTSCTAYTVVMAGEGMMTSKMVTSNMMMSTTNMMTTSMMGSGETSIMSTSDMMSSSEMMSSTSMMMSYSSTTSMMSSTSMMSHMMSK